MEGASTVLKKIIVITTISDGAPVVSEVRQGRVQTSKAGFHEIVQGLLCNQVIQLCAAHKQQFNYPKSSSGLKAVVE